MEKTRYLDCLAGDYAALRAAAISAGLDAQVPACPGWTIADLLEHVAAVYLHKVALLRAHEWPKPWPPDFSGEDPAALLDRGYREIKAELTARPPSEPALTIYEPDQTAGFWVRRMAQETVIHRVDAENAAGRAITPVPDDLGADGIDEVLKVFLVPEAAGWPDEFAELPGGHLADGEGKDAIVLTAGTAPGSGTSWTVRPGPRSVVVTDGADADGVRATLSASPGTLLRWMWGRATDAELAITGDPAWADYLRRMLVPATQLSPGGTTPRTPRLRARSQAIVSGAPNHPRGRFRVAGIGFNIRRASWRLVSMTWKTSTTVLAAGAVVAATAAIAGCGTAHSLVSTGHIVGVASPARTPQQRADADAAAILAAFVAPSGAIAVHGASSVPAGVLDSPASKPLTPDLVDDVAWWRVPGQPEAVLAWEKNHLPRGFSSSGSGISMVGQAETWSEEFSLPQVPGVLNQRELQIQTVSDGNGQALVRVDAQDTWLPARPATDKVPSTATVVTITAVPGLDAKGKPPESATVTDPSTVKRIVSLIDGLPDFPPGAYSCPADTGRELRLTFRSGVHSPVLAVATASTGGCQGVSLMTGGKPQPGLSGGATTVTKTLSIAGLHWPGY